MNKVTVVSLAGTAFHFEEPAHEAVSAYLARASRALSTNPDRAEILLDLEQAIADKCQRFLGKHKNVITAEEAAQVVREMGPVQGGDDEPGSFSTASAQTAYGVEGRPRRRRLMRLPSEGMMGGVCAGLGAYLDIDVVWVRLAFVLLLFPTGGAWFLVWLVMLIIVPAARTPEQMAAARGESLSAREVVEMARRKSADIGKAAASGLRDVERNLRETFGPRN
jgi:phage shock protein PspC (stress-responsive transcriptional regulator)